jgi:hypothetical protein
MFIANAPKGGQFTISPSAESRPAKLPAARDRPSKSSLPSGQIIVQCGTAFTVATIRFPRGKLSNWEKYLPVRLQTSSTRSLITSASRTEPLGERSQQTRRRKLPPISRNTEGQKKRV